MRIKHIVDLTLQDVFQRKCVGTNSTISFDDVELVRDHPMSNLLQKVKFQFDIGTDKICEDLTKSIEKAMHHRERGAKTIFASINGEIAGVYCICDLEKYVPYDFMNAFTDRGKCGMIFHCSTSKKYRNMGLYKNALVLITKSFSACFDTILITSSPFNKKSIRGIQNSEFIRDSRMLYLKLLKYYYYVIKIHE